MWERFTEQGRRASTLAVEEARGLGHASVGPEHLLLGVLGAGDGTAARAAGSLGLTLDRARGEVERVAGRGDRMTSAQIPWTPKARGVVEQALREAMSLGHDDVGTEHLLLALSTDRIGIAGQVLGAVAHPGVVRDAVLTAMDEGPGEATSPDDLELAAAPAAPAAVSVRLGDDVGRLLRRAAGHALAADAPEVTVEHIRAALDGDAS